MKWKLWAAALGILVLCPPLAAEDQYGLFLIDQSASMNSPEHTPRLPRAVDRALEDVRTFLRTTEASGDTAFVKVVTFNGADAYLEHTTWTAGIKEVRAKLERIRETGGSDLSPFLDALCAARDDLTARRVPRANRHIFLYTDGGENVSLGLCSSTAEPAPAPLAAAAFSRVANWRAVLFEETGDSILRSKGRLSPGSDVSGVDGSRLTPATTEMLMSLAEKSRGLLTRLPDPDPAVRTAGLEKSTTTIRHYQYFSVGKSTKRVKRNLSTNAIFWSPGELDRGQKTRKSVSAVRFNDRTYVFHLGETNNTIYYSYSSNGIHWNGNDHVYTNYTRSSPRAVVVNGKIKVYFAHYVSGATNFPQDVSFVESTIINPNGSIVWSGRIDTGLEAPSAESSVPGFYDPASNKEVLMLWNASIGAYQLYESTPGQNTWSVRHTFTYGLTSPAFLNVGGDIFMAHIGSGGALRLAKQSTGWASSPIGSATTDAVPAIGYTDQLVAVYLKKNDDDIMVTRSSDLGATWTPPVPGTELTHFGLAMVAWTEILPLGCSLSGPYFGTPGSPMSWTANASGGDSPYSYSWRINGITVFGFGNSLTNTLPNGTHELQMTVTDSASNTCTVTRFITVSSGCRGMDPCIDEL